MPDYTRVACPVCNEKFDKRDDIVVCPECGAPYHRECYKKVGHCIFADKHGTKESWKSPEEVFENAAGDDERDFAKDGVCPRCGRKNKPDASFCDNCGMLLGVDFSKAQENGGFGGESIDNIQKLFDPLGGVDADERINDVPAQDIAEYVQVNTPYYISVFKRLKDSGANRLNFAGFLFTGGWLLYRKQYKLGAIISILTFALTVASALIYYNFVLPMLSGMLAVENANVSSISSFALANLLSENIPQMTPAQVMLLLTPSIISAIKWGLMFFVGFRANKWYLKHCVRKIEKVRADAGSDAEYKERLKAAGGVNVPLAISLLVCYTIVNVML